MILEHDKGAVFGTTWHKLEQYKQLDHFVPIEMVREIADYPLELRNSFVPMTMNSGEVRNVPTGERSIVRPDIGEVITGGVGEDFCLENNLFLVDHIEENFLSLFPDLAIESVGTLRNGATFFLNLKVKEFQVTGDKSPTVSNLMFVNPLARGAYRCGAHHVRIVCANTLKAADAEAKANGSLFKIRHMKGAVQQIHNALEQMAQFRLGLEKNIEKLERLARLQVSCEQVQDFLAKMYPMPTDATVTPRKKTNVWEARGNVLGIFEGDQDLAGGTAYALLNAYTYAVDHRDIRDQSDDAYRTWGSLYGVEADKKVVAMNTLMELATV
jgi:phage/plasmid-like protein (TIGR03299 family)